MVPSPRGTALAIACLAACSALAGSGPHVVVDPGHGGFQEGAMSAEQAARHVTARAIPLGLGAIQPRMVTTERKRRIAANHRTCAGHCAKRLRMWWK